MAGRRSLELAAAVARRQFLKTERLENFVRVSSAWLGHLPAHAIF